MSQSPIKMIDNPSIQGREEKYSTKIVDIPKALESWRLSLFSFEWLDQNGAVKARHALAAREQEKYDTILDDLKNDKPLARPILGLGLQDNVEIGSKREVFLVLASQNHQSISVHIPKSIENEFNDYII